MVDPALRRALSDRDARLAFADRQMALQADKITALLDGNDALRRRAVAAERRVHELEARNRELVERVAAVEAAVLSVKTSVNSSAPPSADPPAARHRRKYPSRKTSGRPTGGQKGHPGSGSTRREPTQVIRYEPEGMCPCGTDTAAGAVAGEKIRQIIGIQAVVTAVDHVQVTRRCVCGTTHTAPLPAKAFTDGSTNPVVFDTSVKTLAVGLAEGAHIPVKAACGWLSGMLGVSVAEATVRTWIVDLAASLDGWDEHVVGLLRAAPVVGADETPVRVEGFKNAHAHVAVTDRLTRFHLAGRSKADIVAGGVLAEHPGVLVCDGLSAYRGIGVASVQACVAHLLRELRFVAETFTPHNPDMEHPHPQFTQMATILSAAVTADDPDPPEAVAVQLRGLCTTAGEDLEAAPRSKPVTDASALCRRLVRYLDDGSLLRFLTVDGVPATNNFSERAVRPLKVRQRRSGTRRSVPHTRAGLRIAGYLDTARKNGLTPEKALRSALQGHPYLPN